MDEVLKPGGQALADGVFMRTSRAWAIARADGHLEVGAMPSTRCAKVPVVRVVTGLGSAVKLGVVRGLMGRTGDETGARHSRRINRKFLFVLLAIELVVVGVTLILNPTSNSRAVQVLVTVTPWIITLAVGRILTPAALWRYHGAEHKAVTAFESGLDLRATDSVAAVSRIHNRCGTNLVALMMVVSAFLVPLPVIVQLPAFVIALAVSAEVLGWAAARPRQISSRVLLASGRVLQRFITTAEPTTAELEVGCRALLACLAEHDRLVLAETRTSPNELDLVALAS